MATLRRYHLDIFMTPPSLYYMRVVLKLFHTMSIKGSSVPESIRFAIDG